MAAYSPKTGLIENYWLADHLHFPAATLPLVVINMYEHSYALHYGASAAKYIDAFFLNLDWRMVATRLNAARSPGAA